MTRGLVLSLFPGVGALDHAFALEGWCVVNAGDVAFSSLYDVREFYPPPGVFEGVIGGPPCPSHSRLRHTIEQNRYSPEQDLVGEFARVLAEAKPRWWVMENTPRCPPPTGPTAFRAELNARHFGIVQNRVRVFYTSHALMELEYQEAPPEWEHAVTSDARPVPVAIGGSGKRKPGADLPKRSLERCIELQGLPAGLFGRSPLTMQGKRKLVGNAVPLPMGRAVARAVRAALDARGET